MTRAIFLSVALGGCGAETSTGRVQSTSPVAASERTAVIPIEGMSCASCAAKITRTLEQTPGVTAAVISLERKEATVRYLEGEATPEALAAVVTGLGFEAGTPR